MPRGARSPLPWLAGLLALYLLAPILAFLVRIGGGVSSTPGLGSALLTSLLTATLSTVVIAALGVPLAYLLSRANGARGRLMLALVMLPLALPPLMSGLLLLYVLGPYTTVGHLFAGALTDTWIGIVLAQTFVAAPFLVVAARAGFATVDPALEDVARTLGHGALARFWRVAIPTALPGIGAGLLLAWLRSFGEFGATVILAYHPYSLPVFTYVQFGSSGLPATMLPVAVALAAALSVLLLSGLATPIRRRKRHFQDEWLSPPAAAGLFDRLDPPTDPALGNGLGLATNAGLLNGHVPVTTEQSSETLDVALKTRLGSFSLELSYRASTRQVALLGPSGAGKTLTLRLLAGLSANEGGHIRLGSLALDSIACERRGIGYVPQHSSLLPGRTMWQQLVFGARAQPQLAAHWMARLGLSGLEERYPEELSGGQQRRVALARALATAPRLLLLDEPFTGLDAPVRDRMRRDLHRLQRHEGLCTLIVTHDPEEAAMLAQEIIVLDAGAELQAGLRNEVFENPSSPHIAAMLGIDNVRRGKPVAPDTLVSGGVRLRHRRDAEAAGSDEVFWCVHPRRIHLDPGGEYEGTLLESIDLGAERELTVALAGTVELAVRSTAPRTLALGERVRLAIAPEDVRVWAAPGSAESRRPAPLAGAQPPM
jgi:ABC-type sulfate/molybdate transport systems ATPase subunit/ABC-type sulfate transport system permease component